MTSSLTLGPIPLNIGTRDRPSNAPFPDELPFTAQLDERSGVIAQTFDPRVATILDEAYARGSQLGIPMNDYGIGKATCEDFIAFLLPALSRENLRGLKVLEIGCGTGYLLTRLHALGADALGIEPGASSSIHAESAGLRVLHEPFERVVLQEVFDLVVHTGVLEHVPGPVEFLRRQLSLLRPGGCIAFAVPDCEAPLAHGDLSMFVHEHWSYFTRSSLARLAAAAGGYLVDVRRAGVGGMLYALVRHAAADAPAAGTDSSTVEAFRVFSERMEHGTKALREYFSARRGRSVGVYCPGRFINYWRLAGCPEPRFFDDDKGLQGRYFPPVPIVVESRARLLEAPVDSLLIMSRTFGPALSDALRLEPALKDREVLTVAELF